MYYNTGLYLHATLFEKLEFVQKRYVEIKMQQISLAYMLASIYL